MGSPVGSTPRKAQGMGFAYPLVSKQKADPLPLGQLKVLLTTGGERLEMVTQEQEVGCGQGKEGAGGGPGVY